MKKLSYIAAAFLFTGMLSAQQIDLNAMPKPGATPTINIAKPKTFTLPNGLQVMVVENNKLPRVSANLSMDRPPIYEGEKAGVNSLMADQIGKGTKTISKDDFNKKVDYLGASVRFSSNGAFANSLSKYLNSTFIKFSNWLLKRKNSEFTALNIQHYYGYFFLLDEICLEYKRLPTYEEIVSKLTVSKTREYLLVTIFLNEMEIIKIDNKIKEEYANLDMIDKYLNTFERATKNHSLIEKYYLFLQQKLNNKTTTRSIRLALTPAIKFLNYCENFKNSTPSNYILEGYLWCYGGQKAAITGFINFLQKKGNLNISIKNIYSFDFIVSSASKEILKKRFLDILELPSIHKSKEQYFYKMAIGYLHNIEIPKNVYINKNEIKKDRNGDYLILNKHKIYIGKKLIF